MLLASQDKAVTLKASSDQSLLNSPLKKQDSNTSKVIYTSRIADNLLEQNDAKVLEIEIQGTLFDSTKEPNSGVKIVKSKSKPMSPEIKVIKSPIKQDQ